MGVFGIVLFSRHSTAAAEVAVRKVMGATATEILRLFNAVTTSGWSLSGFVIAVPLSLWIVHRWLASFAYRVPIPGGSSPAAFVAVLLL